MSYRYFDGYGAATQMHDGPPPTVNERAADELFANAINGLAVTYRLDIEVSRQQCKTPEQQAAFVMKRVAGYLRDSFDQPAAGGTLHVFDYYGIEGVLTALRRAYSHPQPMGELEGD